MTGAVLYELHPHGEAVFLLLGVLSVLVVLLCCLARGKMSAAGRRRLMVPTVMMGAVLLLASAVLLGSYRQLRSEVERGNCRSVEGSVAAYQQGRNGRQTYESFTVDSVLFYNENVPEGLPGYCLTGDTGGRLRSAIDGNGQRLRVTYVPDWPYRGRRINCIVRMEALSAQRRDRISSCGGKVARNRCGGEAGEA